MTENNEPAARPEVSEADPNGRSSPRRASRPWRNLVILSAVLVALAVAAAGWLGVTASKISDDLNAAAHLVPQLKTQILEDDSDSAGKTVDSLKTHTMEARQAASDPLWTLAGALPWLGQNFQAVSTVATSADDVANLAADPLVSVARSLDWKAIVPNSKGVQLQPLEAAKPKLLSASHAVRQSYERLNGIDTDALFPQISEPVIEARQQLESLRSGLDVAASAALIAPDMLGASTPRNYLLLVQNNAETRATGGIPGALAVMKVNNGKLALAEQTSATELGPMSPAIPVEDEQRQIYSGRVGKFMQDVNLTPDFPTSAGIATSMWQQKTGERLDGVVSVDPVALSYLLGATGPVTLSNPQLQELVSGSLPKELNQTNVVKTLLSDVYSEVPEPALQDLYFASVAEEIFAALSSGKNDNGKLIEGITKGVNEGRVLVWSAVASEQSVLAKYPLGGAATSGSISPAQFGVYFNDGTGAKMDYYVKRTVQLVQECPRDGYLQTKVRVTSTNTAPADAATSLPPYVTGGGVFGVPPGTVQTNVVAYGPVQANVESAVADGKKISFASHTHSGRPVGAVTVALPPGKKSTIDFVFGKIVQHTNPELTVTPTVQARKDVVMDTISETCPAVP